MSVLVTGGAGYVGSHVVLELLDEGEEVVVLDDLSTGIRSAVPRDARLVVGDAGDADLVRSVIRRNGVDAIMHLAGTAAVSDSIDDPLGAYFTNVVKSRALFEAAVSTGVEHIVLASTAAVYGRGSVSPIAESAQLRPITPYASSKMMAEMMLADAAHAHDLSYVALRAFNAAGTDALGRTGMHASGARNLIRAACEVALGDAALLELYGTGHATADGSLVRDYIHVCDLARAHLAALEHLRGGGDSEILNCGYGHGASALKVIETVRRVSGCDFAVRDTGSRPDEPVELVLDCGRILERLAWTPRLDDLETMVAQAFAAEAEMRVGLALAS